MLYRDDRPKSVSAPNGRPGFMHGTTLHAAKYFLINA